MKQYVIERDMPGVGALSTSDRRTLTRQSNAALQQLGRGIEWICSYWTEDRSICIYNAESEELIRVHAQRSGIPVSRITPVAAVLGPWQRRDMESS